MGCRAVELVLWTATGGEGGGGGGEERGEGWEYVDRSEDEWCDQWAGAVVRAVEDGVCSEMPLELVDGGTEEDGGARKRRRSRRRSRGRWWGTDEHC